MEYTSGTDGSEECREFVAMGVLGDSGRSEE